MNRQTQGAFMRSIISGIVLALAVTGQFTVSAVAEVTATGWGSFEEPAERAFTVGVPPGWQFAGGITHKADAVVTSWVRGQSGDRQNDFFQGDPNLPKFALPGFFPGPEGTARSTPDGQTIISHYKTGREFAVEYGPRELPPGSENIQLLSSQDEPELAAKSNALLRPGVTITSGSAVFGYTLNGQSKVSCVTAQTMCTLTTGQTGIWSAFDIFGADTSAANQSMVRQLANQIRFSIKYDQQWMAAQLQNQRNAGQNAINNINDQSQRFGQYLQGANTQFNAQTDANRQYMNNYFANKAQQIQSQQQAQSDWHDHFMNNWRSDMAQKDWNNYQRVLQIQDKHLEWNSELQHNVEVPNYP